MNKFLYLISLSVTLLLHSNYVFAQTVFNEQDGRLFVEVESVPADPDWHLAKEFADYRGNGHLEWTGSNNNNVSSAGDGTLTYHFTINTPGNYEFRWRSYIGEGTNGTEANDSWVRFPTGSNVDGEQPLFGWTKAFMNTVGDWTWRTVTVDHVGELIRQHFTAGEHTVEISGRSRGHVIDRFVLFKYDDVRFNDEVFSNTPQSAWTGDEIVVADIPEPEPEPEPEETTEQNADSGSTNTDSAETNTGNTGGTDSSVSPITATEPTQQLQVPANQLIANECSDGVISLRPVSDITVESNEISNTGELRLNDSGRSSLLQFDLSSVPATVTSAALTWSAGAEAGEGSVLLSAGSHSRWNETDASLLPDISHFIGSFNGSWIGGKRYGFAFDHSLIGTDTATLIMEMAQGSGGMSIIPSVSDDEPRLQLTGPASFCADYESNQTANLVTPDSELTTNANPVLQKESDGGGSLRLLELLFLTSFLTAVQVRRRKL